MNCVYFVMSGVVEITKTATIDDVERETSVGASIEHSFTVDIDESLMLDCSMPLGGEGMFPMGAVNGRLHIDRMKVSMLKVRVSYCHPSMPSPAADDAKLSGTSRVCYSVSQSRVLCVV